MYSVTEVVTAYPTDRASQRIPAQPRQPLGPERRAEEVRPSGCGATQFRVWLV